MLASEMEKMTAAALAAEPRSELARYLEAGNTATPAQMAILNNGLNFNSAKAYADHIRAKDTLSEAAKLVFAAKEARDRSFLESVTERLGDRVADRFAQQVAHAASASPAMQRLTELTEKFDSIRDARTYKPLVLPEVPVMDFKSPIEDLRETIAQDANERRVREERQLELLGEMASLAKTTVLASERSEAQAKREAKASRNTAVRANVVALFSLLVTVILARDELVKAFFWLVERIQ